ncbi:conserved polyketide synthase associated PapA3 domain protein [Mycobacterium ulcerans str. Harvey]|uniref:Conserved polyketide synthase associated PapA3 domain protein n=1 Tax=Mycobacterium ulcerans str. Harvey TaxID=1299332 RepID=A0ABN0RA04_MYCUL|nr:conserved polyketide synthase associated PapA3 domain protein [Mycobacterium ulcerans str. Harvey]
MAEPGSYDNYCNRQREHISGLTLDSPVMSKWTEFFDNNDGSFPNSHCRLAIPPRSAK